jgi:hypothetical protein
MNGTAWLNICIATAALQAPVHWCKPDLLQEEGYATCPGQVRQHLQCLGNVLICQNCLAIVAFVRTGFEYSTLLTVVTSDSAQMLQPDRLITKPTQQQYSPVIGNSAVTTQLHASSQASYEQVFTPRLLKTTHSSSANMAAQGTELCRVVSACNS